MIETFKKIWLSSKDRHTSLMLSLLFSFVKSVFGITQLFAIMLTIDILLGTGDVSTGITAVIILAVICVAGNFLSSYIEQLSIMKTGFFMTADNRVSIGDKLRRLPLGFFTSGYRTHAIATLTTTMAGMESASAMVMIGIIAGLFDSFVIFVFMTIYCYQIGLIAGLGMLVYLMVVSYEMHLSRRNAPDLQHAQSELAESTLTFIEGIKVTKAYSFEEGDVSLKDAIDNSAKANIRLTDKSIPSQCLAHLTIAVFESIILVMALVMFFQMGAIDVAKTIILIIFSFMVYASLNQAGSMLSMIGLLDSAMDEVSDMENQEELEVLEPTSLPESNDISLRDVSFAYGDNEVLHHVSIDIPAHSMTAIVGASGSGKTTLTELIPRFRDVTSGDITIGGVSVKNIPYEEISRRVSMVFQRVYLFEDSILNNVRFGKTDATYEEVREVCRRACADDFIMSLEQGYDTILTEGGGSLSGGERQRISIARAMLKDAPIIILDEATASIDPENEYEIQQAIEELTRDKTVIMIAHKLSTIKNADNIIVLDNGVVAEQGTHDELVARDGIYKGFIEAKERTRKWRL